MDERWHGCWSCRFWSNIPTGTGGAGNCKRRAPVVMPPPNRFDVAVTVWPVTGEAEWCGEHEVKPEITETIASLQDGQPEDGPEAAEPSPPICEHCQDGDFLPADSATVQGVDVCPRCGTSCMPF